MQVVIYARYSTERQSESSITDQVRICRDHADRHGWPVLSVHSDEGISGAALGNRPGAQAAIAACGADIVLLVTDLSRLSRSQDLAPLLLRVRHRGGRVVGVQDGYDSDMRTARMQAGLSGIMSEEFRAMVSDRTHSALETRARDGRPTGGKAYEHAETVKEIFRRHASGESMKEIASDLNRRAVPSPGANWKARARKRGHWQVSTLHAMLQNERYIGRRIWNRSQWWKDPDTGVRHRRERPESEWIIRECEPLIDAETWARVQSRFRKSEGRGGVRSYLLSGLLLCSECGSRLIVMGGGQRRYVCGANHSGGDHACPNRASFPRKSAEDLILEPVFEQMLSEKAIAEGVRLMRRARAMPARKPTVSRDVEELERLVRAGILSPEVAAPALAEAKRRATPEPQPDDRPWPTPAAFRALVANAREILRGDDAKAARVVLERMIGTIPCAANGEHVTAYLNVNEQWLATGTSGISISSRPPLPIVPTSLGGAAIPALRLVCDA